jgi:GTP-dependent dephospho-CoA kinase
LSRQSTGDYLLTPNLRRKLKKPLGRLFLSAEVRGDDFMSLVVNSPLLVTVGDRVTETLQEATGRSPDVFVVDGMERRSARGVPQLAHASLLKAKNPAGRITKEAKSAMKRAFGAERPVMVMIDGEEDLLAIPAVIEAPLGAVIFYGQPLKGVVAVEVDERSKHNAREIMQRMSMA